MSVLEVCDERIERILEAVNNSEISSIKSVVSGIVRIINDPRSTAKDLKDIIQVDPPLSGKILRVSNSVFYSPKSKIDEIEKAIIWIGYNTVKELAFLARNETVLFSFIQEFLDFLLQVLGCIRGAVQADKFTYSVEKSFRVGRVVRIRRGVGIHVMRAKFV